MRQNREGSIFLSYRSPGGLGHANSLRTSLEIVFGEGTVFQDNFSIKSGEEWVERILGSIRTVDVVLVLIHGNDWFTAREREDKYGDSVRLLFRPTDWVRREIHTALQETKVIIPVLLGGVTLWPSEDEERSKAAPEEIRPFLRLQWQSFDPSSFEGSLSYLVQRIQEVAPELVPLAPVIPRQEETSDPLGAMPLGPEIIQRACYLEAPYVGMTYFRREHAPIFFGREEDVRSLYEDHIKSLQPKEVLLLYGQSGVGKSSLLHASLVPRMEYLGWNVAYRRRSKQGGLVSDLRSLEEQVRGDGATGILLILDQVEEMFTDPSAPDEANAFFTRLHSILDDHAAIKLVLSFRKDYLAEVKDHLKDHNIVFSWYSLRELREGGIRRAISGVWKDTSLRRHFPGFAIFEEQLEDAIVRNILADQSSHIAPLLQFQLRTLWDTAKAKMKGDIRLTKAFYEAERLNATSLAAFVDGHKLHSVESAYPEAARVGLVNDILCFYTTHHRTAATRSIEELLRRYEHIDSGVILGIHQSLVDEYLLLHDREAGQSRLSHDSLAGIVRDRFSESQAPGQQAASIVAAKERLLDQGLTIQFSERDIEIVEAGRPGMACLSGRIQDRMQRDVQSYHEERRARYALAMDAATRASEHSDYAAVVEHLQLAAREAIHEGESVDLARETIFPLSELGLEEALGGCLLFLRKRLPSAGDHLDMCFSAHPTGKPFTNWLERWDRRLWERMRERYFPRMVQVAGGEYLMGSEEGHPSELPVHPVVVDGFLMAATPVTCWQYALFCLATGRELPGDAGFGRGARPVINVRWYEAIAYCNWLSEREGFDKVYEERPEEVRTHLSMAGYRLPTEAEWEYAARERGKKIRFGNGQDIARVAQMNFDAGEAHAYYHDRRSRYVDAWMEPGKGRKQTSIVGSFAPNDLGLCDMSGNVWEWCGDFYGEDYYHHSPGRNPAGPPDGRERSIRGGSWSEPADGCRCSYRDKDNPIYSIQVVGFRVVRR